jgi:hypothetical protein
MRRRRHRIVARDCAARRAAQETDSQKVLGSGDGEF